MPLKPNSNSNFDSIKSIKLGLIEMNLSHNQELLSQLRKYLLLLEQWNKTYNLTAIKTIEEMVYKHILDSLVIAPFITGHNLVDVGTGAGLPGIPLACYYPSLQVTLLDSNGKKIRFLRHIKRQLRINNINIVQTRSEDYNPEKRYDHVVARALASLEDLVNITSHLCDENGNILAMKGKNETTAKHYGKYALIANHHLTVPTLGERRLIVLAKNDSMNNEA